MLRVDHQRDGTTGTTVSAVRSAATVATVATRAPGIAARAAASRTAGATRSAHATGTTRGGELERMRGVEENHIARVALDRHEHEMAMERRAHQGRERLQLQTCAPVTARAPVATRTTVATAAARGRVVPAHPVAAPIAGQTERTDRAARPARAEARHAVVDRCRAHRHRRDVGLAL